MGNIFGQRLDEFDQIVLSGGPEGKSLVVSWMIDRWHVTAPAGFTLLEAEAEDNTPPGERVQTFQIGRPPHVRLVR